MILISGKSRVVDETRVNYRLPLDIHNGYSSSFQEFRDNHFHAGIDFRTFQKTGYPVYAISDGRIVKMRVVFRGSGRGLYLKHRDGRTSIYFHLLRFAPRLEKLLQRIQGEKGEKYFGNYELSEPLVVRAGELIAYSGETGSGLPHLHLEIRDEDNRALNPFKLLDFKRSDRSPPIMKRLRLFAIHPARLNGATGETIIPFKQLSEGRYEQDGKLVATGPFDMCLDVIDRADTGKTVGPARISLWVDDIPVFELNFERFAWEDNNQLGFVYDMFHSRPGAYSFNLFSQTGYQLERLRVPWQRFFNELEDGPHRMRLEVRDFFNNLSTGRMEFVKLKPPAFELSALKWDGNQLKFSLKSAPGWLDAAEILLMDGSMRVLGSSLFRPEQGISVQNLQINSPVRPSMVDLIFSHDGKPYHLVRRGLQGGSSPAFNPSTMTSWAYRDTIHLLFPGLQIPANWVALTVSQGRVKKTVAGENSAKGLLYRFKPANGVNEAGLAFSITGGPESGRTIEKTIHLVNLVPGRRSHFRYAEFRADFAPRAVYEQRLMILEESSYAGEFPLLSRQISLKPFTFPFLDEVFYKFKLDEPPDRAEQVGIFNYNSRKKKWQYVQTVHHVPSHTFMTRRISSGTFILMRDTSSPAINLKRKFSNKLSALKGLLLTITDTGKGVDPFSLEVLLNEKVVDCEYDPDRKWVKIADLAALKTGKNQLKVKVHDYAGNSSSRSFYLKLN